MNNTNKDNLNTMPDPLMLRAKDASRLCGLSVSTWYQLKASGQLPPSIKLGKARLWRLDVLRRWTELNCPNLDKFNAVENNEKN